MVAIIEIVKLLRIIEARNPFQSCRVFLRVGQGSSLGLAIGLRLSAAPSDKDIFRSHPHMYLRLDPVPGCLSHQDVKVKQIGMTGCERFGTAICFSSFLACR